MLRHVVSGPWAESYCFHDRRRKQLPFSNVTTALDAPLGLMASVAVDAQGNFYAADASDNIVVQVSPSGVLRVVAGNGVYGFSGDGGPASQLRWHSQPIAIRLA